MAWTNSWDETKPADSDLASSLGQQGRQVKLDIRERLNSQHVFGQNTTDDGLHRNIIISSASKADDLPYLTGSGVSVTGTGASPFLSLSGIWNTTGAPPAIKLNVTDTASDTASLLMDLQVGGVSKFSVSKTGAVISAGGSLPKVVFGSQTGAQTLTTSYADVTGMSGNITPGSSSNKVLVRFNIQLTLTANTPGPCQTYVDFKIQRNGSDIATFGDVCEQFIPGANLSLTGTICTLEFLDSPASTSAQTYKVQARRQDVSGTGIATLQQSQGAGHAGMSTFVLMEVVP